MVVSLTVVNDSTIELACRLDMKVILRSLGELTGTPAAGSFILESSDLGGVWASSLGRLRELTTILQTDDMKKNLKHQCDRFIESIQSLMEKERSSVPETLKVSLNSLIKYDISCF